MTSFASLVLAAVLFKVLGNQLFTPLSAVFAGALFLLSFQLDSRRRRAVEIFLLQFGVLIYALANQDPSYLEHAALVICLLPSLGRLRQIGRAALGEGSILLVLLYVLWSATWTSNLEMSAAGFVMSALCLAFLFGFVLHFEGEWDKVFGHVLVVLAAIMMGSLVAGGMGHGSAGRTFAGVTLHRNQLGFLLGLMILLCLFAVRWRPQARWLHALAGLTAAGLLVFIDSKSAIIAIVFTSLVFLIVSARRWRLYLGLFALAIVIFIVALPSPKWDNFALWMGRDPTFTSRTEIWAGSIGLASQQPFTGYGYNAVWSAHENRLAQFPDAPGPRYAHAHNAWIDWVLQLGLGGLAVYVLFLGVLLVRAWDRAWERAWDRARGPEKSRASKLDGLPVAIQAACLVLYIQVYDLANVSTVPVTRFGFFILAVASLSLWLAAAGPERERLRWALGSQRGGGGEGRGGGGQRHSWMAGEYQPAPRPARLRIVLGLGIGVVTVAALSAYAIWEEGRRFAATEKRSPPAANGVEAASYLDVKEFQWKSADKLADYARRHREGLQEMMKRSVDP